MNISYVTKVVADGVVKYQLCYWLELEVKVVPKLSCPPETSSQSSCKWLVEFFKEISESEKLACPGQLGGRVVPGTWDHTNEAEVICTVQNWFDSYLHS